MRFKRITALLLAFVLVFSSVSVANSIPTYDSDENIITWETQTAKARPNVTYKFGLLGYKASVQCGKQTYFIHFKPSDIKLSETIEKGVPYVKAVYKHPFLANSHSIYEQFRAKYGNDKKIMDEISAFFARADKPLIFDAVLNLKINDVDQGSMTISKGTATFSGKVYHTKDAFLNGGIEWGRNTKNSMDSFFGIEVFFAPQPVGDPVPVIKRNHSDGSRTESVLHTFKEGEPIAIDGASSIFPSRLVPQKYIWTYTKVGESKTIEVVKTDPGTPFKSPLPVGEYNVTLKVSSTFTLPWENNNLKTIVSSKEAKTKLKINATAIPNVHAVVTSPKSVKYEQDESTKDIEAKLDVTIKDIEEKDIKSVYLELYDANRKIEKVFAKPPYKSFSLTNAFSVKYTEDKYHDFHGYAVVLLTNGKYIKTDIASSSTWLYRKKMTPNEPPVPILYINPKVIMGNNLIANGSASFDPDGEIIKYDFNAPWLKFSESGTNTSTVIKFPATGTFEVILGVTDDRGAYAQTSKFVEVTSPPPVLTITPSGCFKENRLVSFVVKNWSSHLSAVHEYTWEATPLDTEISQDKVRLTSKTGGDISGLFREKGRYLVTVSGTNTYGVEGKAQVIIDIAEDTPPQALIDSSEVVYRNSEGLASIRAFDNSYSTDGDFISSRTWSYRFDSDNDGDFEDENWTEVKKADHNDNLVTFNVNKVGKYQVKVLSKEIFGQPTIAHLLTEDDYKTGESIKEVEVQNFKPHVSFDAYHEKKIDIAIITDYEGQDLLNLESKLNRFVQEAYNEYLNVKVEVISDKKYAGRYMHQDATLGVITRDIKLHGYEAPLPSGLMRVEDTNTPKYVVANWKTGVYEGEQIYNHKTEEYETSIVPRVLTEYSDNTYVFDSTLKYEWGKPKKLIEGQFPSRIKKAFGNHYGNFWWLENGDVYFAGSNSIGGVSWIEKPTLLMNKVKQIEGKSVHNGLKYFFLKEDGTVHYMGNQLYFTTNHWYGVDFMNDRMDWTKIIKPWSIDVASPQMFANYYTGNLASPVSGLSNITYIWSDGDALVAKNKTGTWYGLGGGLNDFGLNTGFTNTRVGKEPHLWNYFSNTISFYEDHWFDAVNSPIVLENLTSLNGALGGIKEIKPRWALAHTGQAYWFKETPSFANDAEGRINGQYRGLVVNGTKFEYGKTDYTPPPQIPLFDRWKSGSLTAGWKTYTVDASKVKTMAYRPDSKKYTLYLAKKDSFKNVEAALKDFILEKDIAVRVSAPSSYLDEKVDPKVNLNLRAFASLTPSGKIYGENAIDAMLLDIFKKHQIVRKADGGLYVVVDEESLDFSKFYRDIETDPKFSDTNFILHDESHFDNSMGKSYFHNRKVIQPSLKLDKVGRYELKYSAVDNPVKTDERFKDYRKESDPTNLLVYAHRRPIAQYILDWEYDYDNEYYTSNWTDTSYDLDHSESDPQKGIRANVIHYRKAEDGAPWINAVPNNLPPGDYELRYKVKDIEGAWSKEVYEKFTLLKDSPMVLKAKLVSDFKIHGVPASEKVSIVDIESKYHRPHDLHINLYTDTGTWVSQVGLFLNSELGNYAKNRNVYKWRDVPYRLPAHLKDGAYKMVVTCKSPWAEKSVTLPFGIVTPISVLGQVPELMKGEMMTLSAVSTPYAHKVILTAFKGTPHEVERQLVKQGAIWGLDLEVASDYPHDFADFEFKAYTESGKMAVHLLRKEVKGAFIKAFEMEGAWAYWDGRVNALGKRLEKNPHRFLSYEKVTFRAEIEGRPDEVTVRLSPELESMVYTNAKGQTYYYREHFGEDVSFPLRLKHLGKGIYEGTYILPLADTTINWEETRLKKPYFAKLYVRKGTNVITQTLEDIDLTGNVYELIHAQPKRP